MDTAGTMCNAARALMAAGAASVSASVSHPVLSDLALDTGKVRTFGTHPRKLPDLFKGSQLVVLGRYLPIKLLKVS